MERMHGGLNGGTRLRPLADAAHQIRDCDLLLWRRQGLIAIAGRGVHTHAALALWWDERLFCVEVREWVGGRAVTLASQVRRFPGRIDVFRANSIGLPEFTRRDGQALGYDRGQYFDRRGAAQRMRAFCGCRYGYGHIVRASLYHLFGARLVVRPLVDDRDVDEGSPFCSEAVALAIREGGGVDCVARLADRLTEPANLAQSKFYEEYRCTLVP